MYIYIHTYIHTYIHSYIHTYMYSLYDSRMKLIKSAQWEEQKYDNWAR